MAQSSGIKGISLRPSFVYKATELLAAKHAFYRPLRFASVIDERIARNCEPEPTLWMFQEHSQVKALHCFHISCERFVVFESALGLTLTRFSQPLLLSNSKSLLTDKSGRSSLCGAIECDDECELSQQQYDRRNP